jgi:hypothetical protein
MDIGVLGRLQDADNYYMAQLYDGGLAVITRMGSNYMQLVRVPYSSDENTWYEIRIGFRGTRIDMYVNDMLIASAEDAAFLHGKVGFRCAQGSQAYFDDLLVNLP